MSLSRVHSAAYIGLEAIAIEIEIDAFRTESDSCLIIVGLPDAAVKESKDRVLASIKNSGCALNCFRATINLAPGHLKKEGALYDLPIALGLMQSLGHLPSSTLFDDYLVIGELGLGGTTRPVRGGLCAALLARELGKKGLLLPAANAKEAAMVPGVVIIPIGSLQEAMEFAKDPSCIKGLSTPAQESPLLIEEIPRIDFADIRGQAHVKRALEIAAAGGHNIVMSGPPGSGKTMLAKAMTGIMPEMTIEEALEVTRIHSIAGMLEEGKPLVTQRPFRSPHHTVSYAGLIGGGHVPRPGEVTLAHNGILFLDELPEFSRTVLEVLRQPLEDRNVTISRANGNYTFPTNFICIAAMNPCPCGFLGHPHKGCTDSPLQINRYRSKISGPLWDRIDMHIDVPALRYSEMIETHNEESSHDVRLRVKEARAKQRQRLGPTKCNAMLSSREIKETAALDASCMEVLQQAMERMGLSARVCDRMRKVARTIADLDNAPAIETHHLLEAINFRSVQVQTPLEAMEMAIPY